MGGTNGYDGIVESHPYAVANVPGGWVVADAAGNSLVSVRRNGAVSTLAVLPAHTMTFTLEQVRAMNASIAEQNENNDPADPDMPLMPECVAGHEFAFESVPTDVEIGRNGKLYVSTLPGGPEDPSLGARGKVFEVDRRSGAVKEIATGFAAATDLAITPEGTIYVAELFGGRISEVVDGKPQTLAEVPLPGAVEYAGGSLYAVVNIFDEVDGGSLVRIPLAGV